MENVIQETQNEMVQEDTAVKKRGITGSTLKLIAIITMFIDHIGAIILERVVYKDLVIQLQTGGDVMVSPDMFDMKLMMLDSVFRLIGRLGFPIFCFLLIEGFMHTRNVKKYAVRLFLFALISEIPFDLGFASTPFFINYQNVFFTLFFGLLVMIGMRYVESIKLNKLFSALLQIVIVAAGMFAATALKTDYKYIGVLTIAVMYLFRKRKNLSAGIGCTALTLFSLSEITAFFAMIPIHLYNGKRGWNIKWLFYAFYPVHILLLYLIACALGFGSISLGVLIA